MSALFRTLAAAPLALAVALLTAAPAQASAIYTYTGPNFNSFIVFGPTTPPVLYTAADRVTVVLELAAPLAANLSPFTDLVPLSFTFTDGINTITNGNATSTRFSVATDANGSISAWRVFARIDQSTNGGGTAKTISTQNFIDGNGSTAFDQGSYNLCGPTSTPGSCTAFGNPSYLATGSIANVSTWVLQPTPSVPEPTSLLLVGAALAGLAARRRAR